MDNVKTLDPLSGATRFEPAVGAAGAGVEGRGGHRGRRLIVPGGGMEPEGFSVGEWRTTVFDFQNSNEK